jgi:hypothetical protein
VSAEDVAREAEVFRLQTRALEAAAALVTQQQALEQIEGLYEARVKRRVSAKLRADTYRARRDARRALRDAVRDKREADAQLAQQSQLALNHRSRSSYSA